MTVWRLGVGGVGVAGSNVDAVLRGLVAQMCRLPGAAVIIPEPDIERIGVGRLGGIDSGAIWVTAGLTDALRLVSHEIGLRQSTTTADTPVVLIADAGTAGDEIAAVLDAGRDLAVAGFITGSWPGTTLPDTASSTDAPPVALVDDLITALTHQPAPQVAPATPAPPRESGVAASAAPLVRLQVLGPVTVHTEDRAITAGLRSRGIELLAFLACHRRGAPRSRIIDRLLADVAVKNPAGLLRTILSDTRKQLTSATGLPRDSLIRDSPEHGLHLDADRWRVDIWEFADHLRAARAATGVEERIAALEAAARLFDPGFAEGIGSDWTIPVTTRLRSDAITAHLDLAGAYHEIGHLDEAVTSLEAALEIDPVHEGTYRELMRAHAAAGNPGAITTTLKRLHAALGSIDTAVSDTTIQLVDQLRRGQLRVTGDAAVTPPA